MSDTQRDLRIIERKEVRAHIERKERKRNLRNRIIPVIVIMVLLTAFCYWLNVAAGILSTLTLAAVVIIISNYYNYIR